MVLSVPELRSAYVEDVERAVGVRGVETLAVHGAQKKRSGPYLHGGLDTRRRVVVKDGAKTRRVTAWCQLSQLEVDIWNKGGGYE